VPAAVQWSLEKEPTKSFDSFQVDLLSQFSAHQEILSTADSSSSSSVRLLPVQQDDSISAEQREKALRKLAEFRTVHTGDAPLLYGPPGRGAPRDGDRRFLFFCV
jgi:hypothetical protein